MLAAALCLAAIHSPALLAGDICRHADGTDSSTAPDANAFACGYGNVAFGTDSTAFGVDNEARSGSLAAGDENTAYERSLATGWSNLATGQSTAMGYDNRAQGQSLSAGWSNDAMDRSTAIGYDNFARQSIAIGSNNDARGRTVPGFPGSIAIGTDNFAYYGANALGARNRAWGLSTSVFGTDNRADGSVDSNDDGVIDEGEHNAFVSIFGSNNQVDGSGSTAAGFGNNVGGRFSTAFGARNFVAADGGLAAGTNTLAANSGGTALGGASVDLGAILSAFPVAPVEGERFTLIAGGRTLEFVWRDPENPISVLNIDAIDGRAMAINEVDGIVTIDGAEVSFAQFSGYVLSALSGGAVAFGTNATAGGAASTAWGERAVALGSNAHAVADDSVAIGSGALASRVRSVSVGDTGTERQLIHLADATEATDAVNLRQMRAADDDLGAGIAAWLGGGAAYAGGVFTAPVYVIQSNNYNNVGTAFGAVDAALTDINQRIVDVGGIQGERGYSAYEVAVQNGYAGTEADWLSSLQGPTGPGGPQGPEGPAGGGPRSVVYDDDGRDVLTLAGSNGTTIANVADGVAATDAVNVRQMDAGDASTLASANSYTDTVAVQTLQSANDYTDSRFAAWDAQLNSIQRGIDDRFHQQDRRIDRQGAMGSAMLNMAMNAGGSQSPRGRIAVGAGFQGGEQALSIGYGRKVGNRASFSLGGAFSGGEKSAGIGFGLDL